MSDTELKRVALYVRVSTEEQARYGASLQAQRDVLYRYVKEHGLAVVGEYADEGVSAKKPVEKRPGVVRLLEDVRQGRIDLIVFTKLDRWFRNVKEYYKAQDVLDRHNVAWATVSESYETETAAGRLKVNIMLAVSEEEADKDSERIRFVFANKAARGEVLSGTKRLGYTIVNKHYEIDDTAEDVRFIFEYFLRHQSVNATMKEYNRKYSKNYDYNSIRRILTNRLYIGEAYGNPNFAPPIIPLDDFNMVQEMIALRSQRYLGSSALNVYIFSGLLLCPSCGRTLKSTSTKGIKYYVCRNHKNGRMCTFSRHINEGHLEKWLLENLCSEMDKYNLQLEAGARKKRPKQPDRAAQIDRRLKKLKDLYLADLIELSVYEQEYRELQAEKAALPKPEPEAKPIDVSALQDSLRLYSSLSKTAQKSFWFQAIRKIDISDDGDYIVTPR